jgi:hypothetical protein
MVQQNGIIKRYRKMINELNLQLKKKDFRTMSRRSTDFDGFHADEMS